MAVGYDWHKRLGGGNFGEVWLATDIGLNEQRAVKRIPPSRVPDPTNFFHEAQVLVKAKHANVVTIHETGKLASGEIYIAMEYLKNGSLEDEATGNYLHLTRAKKLMIDVLRGLQHAHNSGILHRDIKPANILVGGLSEGKLSDFGLAIPIDPKLRPVAMKDYWYLIHQAPEVILHGKFSVLTDIYACGVTLYRLVNGDSYFVLPKDIPANAIAGKFPSRDSYRWFVPRPMKTLINRALNLNPDKRFQSAEEMRRALEQVAIEMNWVERLKSNGFEWTCGWDMRCYGVQFSKRETGKYDVVVASGRSKRLLRRINKLCLDGASKIKAEQWTKRVLQDYVLGKLK